MQVCKSAPNIHTRDNIWVFFPEVNNGETQVFNIDESVIWNPELDGIKEFLNVISFGPTQSKLQMIHYLGFVFLYQFFNLATLCNADTLHENSIWNVLFGALGNRKYFTQKVCFTRFTFHSDTELTL